MEFTPDEICITAENKFDDGIYQLLYSVWKETSGEYDPKDDKPIVDPRGNVHTQNETKFKYWAMEQYGMTAEEYRGHTLDGTLKTLGEIDMAKDKVMIALALPSMIKNAAKTVKDFANGVPFDTSIGFAAGNGGKRQTQNIAGDVTEEALEDIVSRYGKTNGSDWINKTSDLAKQAPITIPSNATTKVQAKSGYDQISFKWKGNDGCKYEVRWHTKTPGAPDGQGNTWVVSKVTPGTPTGQVKTEHILVENNWIPRYQWQQAIQNYRNKTATSAELELLRKGHWEAP